MRYIDDILCLFGILCIVVSAFGVDWRLGMLALGVGLILTGVFVGRFLGKHPEVLLEHLEKADQRRKERERLRERKQDGGEGR